MRILAKFIGICLLAGVFVTGTWAVPPMINYQGAIVDSNGVPVDGMMQLYFNMWDDSVSGNLLWSEVHASVQVRDGLFDVLLGSYNPIPRSVFNMDSVWLEVGQDWHPPMLPRQRIATVPYAFHAAYADTAGIALSSPPPGYAGVYTVAMWGGNFTSVRAAILAIPPGQRWLVRVMPGFYIEPPMQPLTIPQNVTLKGAGRESCRLDCGWIEIYQPSVEVSGFTIRMTCSIYINATDVTVCDNDISSSTESGITINGAGLKPMIHDNRIHNCAAWGVDARYGCEPFIHDNRISDNTQGGVLFNEAGGTLSNNNIFENGPFGVKVRGPQVQPSTLTIDDNQIGNHSDAGVLVEVGVVSIQGNTIFSYMEMGDGIEITGSGVAQVVGNTISNCGHNGIYLNYSEAIPPSHIVGNTIRFNTFGIAGGMGCPLAIISSNIILQNVQDITYIPPTWLTFNNNTFDTTEWPPTAMGSYNAMSNGLPINP